MFPSHLLVRIGMLLVAVAASLPAAKAQEPDAQPASFVETSRVDRVSEKQIDAWIAQLGDDSYRIRETAAGRLLSAGARAREALRRAATSADPETRAAAERLVTLIDQVAFDEQLQAFADDVDGRRGIMLPGWNEFRELFGAEPAMRELFVEMQRHEAALLRTVFEGSEATADNLWRQRAAGMLNWQAQVRNREKTPPLGSFAAVVFTGAVAPESNRQHAEITARIIGQRPLQAAMRSGSHQEAVRKLVGHWLVHCPNRDPASLQQRLEIGVSYEIKEVVPLALDMASEESKNFMPPHIRSFALLAIAKLGNRDNIDEIEPLLADEAVCQVVAPANAGNRPAVVQVRDVALAVSLHLAGEDPRSYGFQHVRTDNRMVFNPSSLGMADDAARKRALAKWRSRKAAAAASADKS